MILRKFCAALSACMLILAAGCGDSGNNSSSSDIGGNSLQADSTDTEPIRNQLTAIDTVPQINFKEIVENSKKYTHSNKAFVVEGHSTLLAMENGWEIILGGEQTEQQTDFIKSFPAVIQYLDTKDTVTVVVSDECEGKEEFLANTKESYIEAYGAEYDSITITGFEQLTIDEFDSFKITADVVVKGESFKMTHVLSNDVSGKTYSWMLLDNDGLIKDFDLVEAIVYPKVINIKDRFHKGSFNPDDYHKAKAIPHN